MSADIDASAEELKQLIRSSAGSLEETCFLSWSGLCSLLTAYLRAEGAPGWSAQIVSKETGMPLFDSQQQAQLESSFAQAPWLLPVLQMQPPRSSGQQRGGAMQLQLPKVQSQFLQDISPTPFDISLDRGFEGFLQATQRAEDFLEQFREETPGVAKLIRTDVPIGAVPVPLQAIVSLLFSLIDAIRLSAAYFGSRTIPLLLLSLLKEFVLGEWRQMIFTALGFLSPSGVAAGILAKYVLNAWLFVSPTDRTDILKTLFRGYKSALAGFFLWASVTFTPNLMKLGVENALERIRLMVENIEEKKSALEAQGSQALAPFGKKLVFPQFDVGAIRRLSLADVQTLQALAEWTPMQCSKEFRAIVDPLVANPGLRLVLEMFNIPTDTELLMEMCPGGPKPLAETVKEMMTPAVVDDGMPVGPLLDAVVPAPAPVAQALPQQQGGSPSAPRTGLGGRLHRHTRKAVKKLQKLRRKTPKARRLA